MVRSICPMLRHGSTARRERCPPAVSRLLPEKIHGPRYGREMRGHVMGAALQGGEDRRPTAGDPNVMSRDLAGLARPLDGLYD